MLRRIALLVMAALLAFPLAAAEINDLDITDDNNIGRFPEGMTFANVNNSARALEGIIARWHKDTNGSLTTTGSANAYALTTNQTIAAYYTGLRLTAKVNFTNTGAATLNVNVLGAKAIKAGGTTDVASRDLVQDHVYDFVYDGTNFQVAPDQAPGVTMISGGTVSSQSSLGIVLTSATHCAAIRFILSGVDVSSDGAEFLMRTSTNAGSSYDSAGSDYRWSAMSINNGVTGSAFVTGETDSDDDAVELTGGGGIGNASAEAGDFEILLQNPSSTFNTRLTFSGTYLATDGVSRGVWGSGERVAAADVDAVQFLPSAGTFSARYSAYCQR